MYKKEDKKLKEQQEEKEHIEATKQKISRLKGEVKK